MLRASTAPETVELEPPAEATPIWPARQPAGSVLYLDGVSVSFDGFKALNNLSLVIDKGEMRTIIGSNGAGKTTMIYVITGKTRTNKVDFLFDGKVYLSMLDEAQIANLGIVRYFQKPTV